MDVHDVIIAPRITEKAMGNATGQQYTFSVHPGATKTQIRFAVESIFKVNVLKINTVNVAGKTRNATKKGQKTAGKTPDFKKATVTIKPGQKIELGGVNYFEQ